MNYGGDIVAFTWPIAGLSVLETQTYNLAGTYVLQTLGGADVDTIIQWQPAYTYPFTVYSKATLRATAYVPHGASKSDFLVLNQRRRNFPTGQGDTSRRWP